VTKRKDEPERKRPAKTAGEAEARGRREYYIAHESVCALALRTEGCVRRAPAGRADD